MKYALNYDQQFAIINDLTLTEVNCLAACFTLPIWSEATTIDGKVWYWYSEANMCKEFPLLFGNPKRAYKNIKILADKGFIETNNLGRKKLLRFTDKCKSWMKPKEESKTENGLSKTENGLSKTENGLSNYDENNTIEITTTNKNTIEEATTEKDYLPETSGDTLFADVVIEKETFGLTPSQVGVTKKTFDSVTAKIQRLQFPTNADNEFKRKFVILACSPKWQKKTIPALQMNIKKLSEYDLEFASELIDKSIAGGWQGVVFSNTPEEYKKWKDSRFKQGDGQVNYDAIKEYLNNC